MTKDEVMKLSAAVHTAAVELPEPYTGTIYVKVMDGVELDTFDDALDRNRQAKIPHGIMSVLATLTMCDEKGVRLFANQETPEVAKLPGPILQAIWDKALGLNKRRKADAEELKGN